MYLTGPPSKQENTCLTLVQASLFLFFFNCNSTHKLHSKIDSVGRSHPVIFYDIWQSSTESKRYSVLSIKAKLVNIYLQSAIRFSNEKSTEQLFLLELI